MPQIINTNIAAMNAQRNLNRSQRENEVALQRLSSGLRINSARDDAAGLAISSRFETQIRGSNQAIRNSGDAISLSQTTEGALSSISNALQRIRELALQAANDTNTALDRVALQEEVAQLQDEIQNIAETTNFNGRKLLDGTFNNATFQVGSNVGDTISFSIGKISVDALGSSIASGISSTNRTTAIIANTLSNDALAAGDLVINGISIQASIGSDDNSSVYESSSSAIAKAAVINRLTEETGVTATVNANYVNGSTGASLGASSGSLTINGTAFDLDMNTQLTMLQNLISTADLINEQSGLTGVRAEVGASQSLGITLIADDGRNISIGGAGIGANVDEFANDFGILSAGSSVSSSDVYVGSYTLVSNDGSDIVISTDTGNIDRAGFEEATYSGVNSGVVSDGGVSTAGTLSLATGDLVINGVATRATNNRDDDTSFTFKNNSAIAKAASINEISEATGVTANVNENRLYSGTIISSTLNSNITINGVSVSVSFSSNDDVDVKLSAIIDGVNGAAGQTGVSAEALDGDSFVLIAKDGRNITLSGASTLTEISSATYISSISLEGGGDIALSTNTAGMANSGFRQGVYGGGEKGTLLRDLDISSVQGANDSIIAIDNAIQTVSTIAAQLGAIQNRFDSVITNLELRAENLSAANSRIKDADFAMETAALSKTQVLQQAGISILAQANARPQQVLSLLQ